MRPFALALCSFWLFACAAATPAPAPAAATPAPAPPPEPEPERETWAGTVVLPADLRDFVVRFERREGEPWKATFDLPSQGLAGLALQEVTHEAAELGFTLERTKAAAGPKERYALVRYEGQARGWLMVGGQRLAVRMLKLAKGEAPRSAVNRPQTPVAPFPYAEREVQLTAADGVALGGTLTVPTGEGPFPAALLLTGSGPQDRDETLFGHKPFRLLADQLARAGVAVLRLDDRGVGKSGGDSLLATTEVLVADAVAALAFLKANKELDPKHLGLVGHSEGGMVAALVAAQSKDVSFIVALAGPALPGGELIAQQAGALVHARGLSLDSSEQVVAAQRKVMDAVRKGVDDAALTAAVVSALEDSAKATGSVQLPREQLQQVAAAQLPALKAPWYRSLVRTDPRPAWGKTRCPVLYLVGDKDLQVPADANLKALGSATQGAKRVTAVKLAGLNHLLQRAKTGLMDEYGDLEETMDPAVLAQVTGWVKETTRKR